MATFSSPTTSPYDTAPPTGGGRSADTEPGADGEAATAAAPAPETPGAGSVAAANDRSFDFSLRVLTGLVVVGLLGSVGLLGYRWIAPRIATKDETPAQTKAEPLKAAPAPANAEPAPSGEVLMDPRKTFKCEEQGRITFSDHACTGGPAASPAATPAAGH